MDGVWVPEPIWTLWGKRKIFCSCRESKHNFLVDLFLASRNTESQVSLQNFSGFAEIFEGKETPRKHAITVSSFSIPMSPLDDSILNVF